MSILAQNTKLNVTPGGIIPIVHVTQYDVNRELTFTLYDGNGAASIRSDTQILIEGTKPDGHGFQYLGSLSGNVVTVNTTMQMCACQGTTECKLKLSRGTQVIGTALFILEVEKAGLQDNTDISDTDIPLIVALATEQMVRAEAAADTAVDSRDIAVEFAEKARRWAVGVTDDGSVPSDVNNSKYYAGRSEYYYAESVETLNSVRNIVSIIEALFGRIGLITRAGANIVTKSGDALTVKY